MRLRPFTWLSGVVMISVAALAFDSVTAPPQRTLKTYPLPNSPNSADISPDESLVATEYTIKEDASGPDAESFIDLVQVWDFKERKLAGQLQLEGGTCTLQLGSTLVVLLLSLAL
jgi:hypothetical protein